MAKTETQREIKITNGPTSLLIRNDATRLASRGSAIQFNTIADLLAFSNEFSIIMVELTTKLQGEELETIVLEPDES
ncbi:hypothetical protein LCGC14_0989430 [marine sediment metagenome]|uniref:Uncharacterized protein n=1 Tax=marine sediment metagenome TaxID=412755 RepID=A0A0F9NAT6_9ZZZZ